MVVDEYNSDVCFASVFCSYSQTTPVLPQVLFCDLIINEMFNVRFGVNLRSEGE